MKSTRFRQCVAMAMLLLADLVAGPARAQRGSTPVGIEASGAAPWYSNSYALLIGVSDYTAGWDDLPSVPGELANLAAALESHHFEVRQVLDPTSVELNNALRGFVRDYGYLSPDDRLFVFFAGHGHTETLGDGRARGYIVPSDAPVPQANLRGFKRKAMSMKDIMTEAEKIEAKHALFVFDSCFSGSIFKTRSRTEVPPHITARTDKPVRQFITAGSADEAVPGESLFTPTLVQGLNGSADLNGDSYVTGSELGDFLHDQVVGFQVGQTPQSGKINDPRLNEGDFVFASGEGSASQRSVAPVNSLAGPILALADRLDGRLGATTAPSNCNEFSTSLDYGLRYLYCRFHRLIDISSLSALAGTPVFLSGPHGDEPDFHASSFGHYNPAFVEWVVRLLPRRGSDTPLTPVLRRLYALLLKDTARAYLTAHNTTHRQPSALDEAVLSYERGRELWDALKAEEAKWFAEGHGGESFSESRLGSGMSQRWQQAVAPHVKLVYEDSVPVMRAAGHDVQLSNSAPGFWFRRYVDGTDDLFYDALVKLMRNFDQEYFEQQSH